MVISSHSARAAASALAIVIVATSATTAVAQGSPIQLVLGERKVISLSENPTTGYVWRFDPRGSTNAAIVTVHDLGFSRPKATRSLVGAPGIHRWSIEGLRAGRARLRFINSRPWEGRPVRRQTIAVEVR
ncbi:MAG: protease inhibitor I42 family protein [Xanthobacteraceae bacterium]